MNTIVSALTSFADSWWPYLVHATWQSALVGLLLLAAVRLMRHRSAPLQYGVLVVALLKFAAPPLFIVSLAMLPAVLQASPEERAMHSPPGMVSVAPVGLAAGPAAGNITAPPGGVAGGGALSLTSASMDVTGAKVTPGLTARISAHWRLLLLAVQLTGAAVVASFILMGVVNTMRFANRCEVVDDGELWQAFCRVRRRMGLRRAVQLFLSSEDCTPVALGLFRPGIVLSKSLVEQMDSARLEAVLAHELAHHRRGDLWFMAVESLLMVVWWFHPVFWLVRRALRNLREDCCDDILLDARITDGETYCETLLQAAKHAAQPFRAHAALGLAESFHPLGRRLIRIMNAPLVRPTRLSRTGLLTLAALAIVLWPGVRFIQGAAQAQAAPPAAAKPVDPALMAEADKEIQAHYAKADADVQAYVRWTAENFGRNGLWLPASAFDGLGAEDREKKVLHLVEVLKGEYGRHLCPALAEAGVIKDKRLLPGLMQAAAYHREDGDYDCRAKWMGVAALGRQDDESAAPVLVPLVDHGNQNTRMWARASLARLTGQNFGADKQAWGKWWNESGKQPAIDLSQLKPWTPPATAAAPPPPPQAVGPPQPPAAPPAKLGELPGVLVFAGRYQHFSRGAAIAEPAGLWVKRNGDELGVIAQANFLGGLTVACGNSQAQPPLQRYENLSRGADGQSEATLVMTFQPGKTQVTRKNEKGEKTNEEYATPEGAWFDPNSRPDPYCAAQILFQTLTLKPGEQKELDAYDWDNTGKGMAAYKIRLSNSGKEQVEAPAGLFEANHVVLEQLSSGDTWFKKRAGHLTDFWVLDNGVIVRIRRHREPYELQLFDWQSPAELPGLLKKGTGIAAAAAPSPVANSLPGPVNPPNPTGSVYQEPWAMEAEYFLAMIQGVGASVKATDTLPGAWSGGKLLLFQPTAPAAYTLSIPTPPGREGTYPVRLWYSTGPDHGICEFWVNGERVLQNDLYRAEGPARVRMEATVHIKEGATKMEFKIVGKNPAASGYVAGIDCCGIGHLIPPQAATTGI